MLFMPPVLESWQSEEARTSCDILTALVRILLPMQETQETRVQSLGREDPLEKEMATHSSFLPWTIPRAEEPGSRVCVLVSVMSICSQPHGL